MQIGLKERLIGAAVLVIIAAIVIPWLLKGGSSPHTTVNQPLTLPQASTVPAAQTYHMALSGPATVSNNLPASAATRAPLVAAASRAPAPVQQSPAMPASKPVAASPHKPSARTAAAGRWVVQAGSYSSERNALAVEHKLVKRGFHAYVSRFQHRGRTYYRVRVGPYAERTEAERAASDVARAFGGHAQVMPGN